MADTIWIFVLYVKLVVKTTSTDGYQTLARNILDFNKKGKLGFHFERICKVNSYLLSVLTTNKAVYHHSCFSKYSDSKLKHTEMYRT